MKERITDKIKELKDFIGEFEEIIPQSFEQYKKPKDRAACERYVEKIVEAAVDIAFFIIKYKKIRIPEDDKSAFDILFKNNIITLETSKAMKSAKGMKNIISHQYDRIDDEIVYESITNELIRDSRKFIREIEGWLKKS